MDQAVVEPLFGAEPEQQLAAVMAGKQICDLAVVAIGSGVFPGRTDFVADFTIGVADTGSIELVSKRTGDLIVPCVAEFRGREFGFHREFGILPLIEGVDDFGCQAIELLERPAVAAVAPVARMRHCLSKLGDPVGAGVAGEEGVEIGKISVLGKGGDQGHGVKLLLSRQAPPPHL